jgi:ABC-2 type transport system permease protein
VAQPSGHGRGRHVLAAGLVVALGLAVWLAWSARTGSQATGPLAASGTVEADETILSFEAPGRITVLAIDEGSAVSAGDLIGRLDDTLIQLQVRQSSEPATRQQLELQAERFTLRSPTTGVITRLLAHVGEVVTPGQPVATAADLRRLKLVLYLKEQDLGLVRVGERVAISADPFPSRSFAGTITSINSRAEFTPRNIQTQRDRLNLVFGVRVEVENPDNALKAGMPVDATFDVTGNLSPMLSRVRSIIRKEFIQIRRDPRTLAMVLALPALQLLLFGYAINTVVDHLPMVVFDESKDPYSRQFVSAFGNTGYFEIRGQLDSREAVAAAIDAGDAKVGLILPPGFGDDILRRQVSLAQLIVDGSDPNTAQTALFAGGMIAAAASESLQPNVVAGRQGAIELRPVVLYNPSMLSVNFMIPGLIGLILQFQTLILTAFAIVRERERGTLEQLVVTPIRSWELMIGKIIPYVATAFMAVAVALLVARVWFGVETAGSLPLLVLLSLLFLLSSLGIGLFISTISQTQTQAMQLAVFVMLPSVLLSGFMFPRESMPWIIQQLGLLIPLTYFLQILRGIMLKGIGLDVLFGSVVPLAIFGVAVFGLSAARFRKRLG